MAFLTILLSLGGGYQHFRETFHLIHQDRSWMDYQMILFLVWYQVGSYVNSDVSQKVAASIFRVTKHHLPKSVSVTLKMNAVRSSEMSLSSYNAVVSKPEDCCWRHAHHGSLKAGIAARLQARHKTLSNPNNSSSTRFLSSCKCLYQLWGPHNFLINGYWGLFPGVKWPGCYHLTTHFHLVLRLIMNGALPLFLLYAFMV